MRPIIPSYKNLVLNALLWPNWVPSCNLFGPQDLSFRCVSKHFSVLGPFSANVLPLLLFTCYFFFLSFFYLISKSNLIYHIILKVITLTAVDSNENEYYLIQIKF